ncbi:AraC family transcriptional regulator [bacterium]|nr:AraC family transcriptional regulator [bacterium]
MKQNLYYNECLFVSADRDIKPYPIYVGDVIHSPDNVVSLHTHGHYEFSLFLTGEVDVLIGQKRYILRPGDVLVTKPGDIHQFSPISKEKEGWHFIYFGIDRIEPEELGFAYMKNRRRQFHDCYDLKPLLAQMLDELRRSNFGVQNVVSSLMTRILYLIARKIAPSARDRQAFCDVVGSARAYIDANSRHGLSIKQIADACCLSESRLSHVFAEKTGMTLSGYIRHVLMHAAIRMLEDTHNTVTGIADHFGYPSPQYFSRVFKKFWGYSPRECRSALRRMHGDFHKQVLGAK